jgi:site-specific DNA recombinase
VREVLNNPKTPATWCGTAANADTDPHDIKGRVNPPSAWAWSPRPAHEPLVTRELFEAASTVGRFRQRSRTSPGLSLRPNATRSYALRSYVICDLGGHRSYGCVHKGLTYYRSIPRQKNHGHLPWLLTTRELSWFARICSPSREDLLTEPLETFFRERIFGAGRKSMLAAAQAFGDRPAQDALASRTAALTAKLGELRRRQGNLIKELETFESSGDPDADAGPQGGDQDPVRRHRRGATHRQRTARLGRRRGARHAPTDLTILDQLPLSAINLDRLADHDRRALYDVFQLELRVNPHRRDLVIRVTVTSDMLPVLSAAITRIIEGAPDTNTLEGGPQARPPGRSTMPETVTRSVNYCVRRQGHTGVHTPSSSNGNVVRS